MTLQEAKEQAANNLNYESWNKMVISVLQTQAGAWEMILGRLEQASELYAQSCAKEARGKCIGEIRSEIIDRQSESIHPVKKPIISYYDQGYFSACNDILLNLKEKSICNHDKEPVTGSDGCEECPDCGKYGEDC